MKRIIFSLAVLMFYVPSFNAFGAEKETQAGREPAAVALPTDCLKVVQLTVAAANNPLGNKPSDYSVKSVKITHVGPPPSPADGPNMPLSYKASVQIAGTPSGTVSVRIVRGGCIVTNYNE